jgi:cytosine/adenosine deaminase-related metal-dependent hydrolase
MDQGFCVRFPAQVEGEDLETWEDWDEAEFLAEDGSVEAPPALSAAVLAEAREVLQDAEDGCHLHLHESED